MLLNQRGPFEVARRFKRSLEMKHRSPRFFPHGTPILTFHFSRTFDSTTIEPSRMPSRESLNSKQKKADGLQPKLLQQCAQYMTVRRRCSLAGAPELEPQTTFGRQMEQPLAHRVAVPAARVPSPARQAVAAV